MEGNYTKESDAVMKNSIKQEEFVNVLEACKAQIWIIESALANNNIFGELAEAVQIVLCGIRNQLDDLVVKLEETEKEE